MRHLLLRTFLLLALAGTNPASVSAQGVYETLDPGPMPAVPAPRPVPTDWRRDSSPAEVAAQIAALSRHRPETAAKQEQLRQLRARLRPMLPPAGPDLAMRREYEQMVARRRERRRSRVSRGSGFSIQSLQEPNPEKEFLQVKATPVYLRSWTLQAGHEYTIETRGLSAGSDTVLYLAHAGQQVAMNDNRAVSDPASLLRYLPPESGDYTVIIRALDETRAGTCDLYVDGEMRETGIQFAGAEVHWSWKPGDQFQTAHLPSTYARPVDTVLLAFDGLQLVGWNDDGGIAGCSLLKMATPSTTDSAHVLVGTTSRESEDSDWVMLYRNALSGPDTDGDGLADSLENSLGTDPNSADTDGDGLRDDWEVFGVHTPSGDEDLPSYGGIGINSRTGSDPRVKDLFLEIDWMAGPKSDPDRFRPLDAAVELVTRQFWQSGGIVLHIDLGQMGTGANRGGQLLPYQASFDLTGTDPLSLESCFSASDWFAPSRHHLFAYMVCSSHFPDRVSSGHMIRFNEDGSINQTELFFSRLCPAAIVSMGTGINGSVEMEAGTIMHEFGHCLNLQHGGFESFNNFKPNYVSSMNYLYQFGGLDDAGAPDYSHGDHPSLDERLLDERLGIGPVNDHVCETLCRGRNNPSIHRREDVRCAEYPNAIDWDGDGRITSGPVRSDFNADGWMGPLKDFDDWTEVRRPGGGTSWVGLNAGVESWSSADGRS